MRPDETEQDFEASVLEGARAALGPSESQKSRLMESLAVSLASGAFGTPELAETGGALGPVPNGALLGNAVQTAAPIVGHSTHALVAGVVLGLLTGMGGGYALGQAVAVDTVRRAVSAKGPEEAPLPKPADASDQLDEDSTVGSESTNEARLSMSADEGARQRRSGPLTHEQSAPPYSAKEAELTFYGELHYLQDAQAALRDGKGARALGLMDSLDQKPNKGALRAERDVTRVLALCQLGRVDEARAVAQALMRQDSARAYRERLNSSCAGAGSGTMADSASDE